MSSKMSLEEKVLEYWYVLGFLEQDKYPQKELIDASNAVKSLKKKLINGQKGYKSIFDFLEVNSQNNLYEAVRREAELCHMKKWGNITVYIGRVKREACIKCIAKRLPFKNEKDERPERNFDDISCASLQLTPEGKYMEHSLSLSTIVWAMKQIKNCGKRVSDCLDEAAYNSALEEMERIFFPKKNKQEFSDVNCNCSEKITEQDMSQFTDHTPQHFIVGEKITEQDVRRPECGFSDSMQEFGPDAAGLAVFKKIYNYIEKEYLRDSVEQIEGENPYELIIGISFQMFIDNNTKNKEEDDNYLGLSHAYFSDDLKMLLNQVRNGNKDVPEYVLDYIASTYRASMCSDGKKRIDLMHPSDRKVFERQVQEIMNVRNAPMGKWPSKYMPAFMQQMAINLAVKKGTSPLFGENGEIFSVNGPPGTGKTTLLKEIVVNNVIERAILLANYDNPDDAFDTHSFQHGTKQNNAYSQYTQHWYSLKEEKINDYSILVASCNNAAVENISKELPLGSGILKDLSPAAGDSDEMKEALDEVRGLFDFSRSCDTESYERNSVEYPDIYFTYYAQKLLNEQSAWGLIAAPLGKKKNIREFYRCVLSPLRWDFYPTKDSASNRLPKYKAAKERFLQQEKLVREMKEQIAHICDLKYSQLELERKNAELEKDFYCNAIEFESRKRGMAKSMEEMQEKITAKTKEKSDALGRRASLEHKKSELAFQIEEGKKRVTSIRQEAFQTLNSVGKRPLLFGRAVYQQKLQYAQKVAEDYDRQAEEQSAKNEELSLEAQRLTSECDAAAFKLETIEENLKSLHTEIKRLNSELEELDRKQDEKWRILEDSKIAWNRADADYETSIQSIHDGKELNAGFISELLSEERDVSTEAQVANPWFTMRYNREREKLFYYAMKMNKEFILATKKCRDNFTSLAHYWGLQPGDEKEKLVFHEADREACVGALYQTLFLLVPVISTTFASVGTFFRDVKANKMIGTLIVDEAGQAQPQMAVGALYRCRKAIVVGEPKQVEPVVTDDLKLLKKAFDDVDLKPYISDKTISVQSCADKMNVFGTYLDNPEHPDFPDWIGCPLLVHRRCISPMYEISNAVSYNGIMKKKTMQPNSKLEETFIYEKSQWIQIKGKEKGNKNHFVDVQADKVCVMLEIAFNKNEFPSLYIISPFTTVVSGVRSYIRRYKKNHAASSLAKSRRFEEWMTKNIGTVHTFQGKEANEVIFLLGCDGSREAEGAVRWVNSNIVNVAVTRAKYRLYIVGDASVWNNNSNIQMAKNIMDTFAIKEIHSILTDEKLVQSSKERALKRAVQGLPPVTSFSVEAEQREDGSIEYSVDTEGFVSGLETYDFMKVPFTSEQLSKFGFAGQKDISKLHPRIRKNLELGMRLFYFLQPVYAVNKDFDASCCAILFCKAMELQMKECFIEGLQEILPEIEISGKGNGRKRVKLNQAGANEFTLGTFQYVIGKNSSVLGQYMHMINETKYDKRWWDAFSKKLSAYTNKRNKCCHDGLFQWKHLSQLLADMFLNSGKSPQLAGLMFESEVGRQLKR